MTGMSGQCLCGAVKFTTEGAADEHEACHCRMCRRWGGGPFFASHAGNHPRLTEKETLEKFSAS